MCFDSNIVLNGHGQRPIYYYVEGYTMKNGLDVRQIKMLSLYVQIFDMDPPSFGFS